MKNNLFYSLLFIATLSLLTSCKANQSTTDMLKDSDQRREITSSIVHHPDYSMEMMQEMMSNDSCKQMMSEAMMKDSSMMKMMMQHMMNMAEKDSSMCKNMMQMMHEKPMIMDRMKEMSGKNMPVGSIMYTCPMHPEVTSDKPGKCPKCGMALVKKTVSKTDVDHKMKM